ncbi:glycoside hydrolase family 5 protein [Sorangium sp. So ce388]|uniref:glycoside hydrolase family 5 protein n=1 Tax=Sorangium sp. So ce388 TaxID=3133309 RepID=UPI003F5B7430
MKNALAWALVGLGAVATGCRGQDSEKKAAPAAAGNAAVNVSGAAGVDLLAQPLSLRGISLAGAEFAVDPFGKGTLPGTPGVHYAYPDPAFSKGYTSADYFLAKGMNTFRVPFRWERLQPARNQPLNAAELNRLKTTVNNLVAKGAYVVLDVHNYGRYGTGVVGAEIPVADFAEFWGRLAVEFKGNARVVFALMNEPHDMPTEQWIEAANAAIVSIRSTGATNLIIVPGNGWSGAHSFEATFYGTSNAEALLKVADPKHHVAFEVHQHLDDDSSGKSPDCVSETVGVERLKVFTAWLRKHGKKGFLGEFGGGSGAICLKAIANVVVYLEQNNDVYVGWTYWAAGPSWKSYFTSLEPRGGADAPQMASLQAHLSVSVR